MEIQNGSAPAGNPATTAPGTATGAPTVETAPTATPPTDTTPAAPAAPSFIDGVGEEYRGLVEAKGWEGVDGILKSYQNLEGMVGAKGAIKPADDADQSAWDEYYTQLGRPETHDGYELGQAPEGHPGVVEGFDGWFKEEAFKQGVSKQAAENIWNEYLSKETEHYNQIKLAEETAAQKEVDALKSEWGVDYERNTAAIKNALGQFLPEGADASQIITDIEKAVGFDGVMKFMHNVAQKIGEPTPAGMGNPDTGAGAAQRLAEIQGDPDYINPNNNPARYNQLQAEATALYARINGEA